MSSAGNHHYSIKKVVFRFSQVCFIFFSENVPETSKSCWIFGRGPPDHSFLDSDIGLEHKSSNPRNVPAVKYHTPRKDIHMYLSNFMLLTCEKSREVPSDRAAEFGPVLAHHLFTSPRRPRWGVVSWRATGSRSGGVDPVAPYKIF